MASREDMDGETNGGQCERISADALHYPKNGNLCGYWKQHSI